MRLDLVFLLLFPLLTQANGSIESTEQSLETLGVIEFMEEKPFSETDWGFSATLAPTGYSTEGTTYLPTLPVYTTYLTMRDEDRDAVDLATGGMENHLKTGAISDEMIRALETFDQYGLDLSPTQMALDMIHHQ